MGERKLPLKDKPTVDDFIAQLEHYENRLRSPMGFLKRWFTSYADGELWGEITTLDSYASRVSRATEKQKKAMTSAAAQLSWISSRSRLGKRKQYAEFKKAIVDGS